MSIPKQQTIKCPKCGSEFETTVFQSINTDYAQDVPEQIISGKLFEAECPFCGASYPLEYDILYHDLKHEAMIYVLHPNSPHYESELEMLRGIGAASPYKMKRYVANMDELREKVLCIENDFDDRIIELCKAFVTSNLMMNSSSVSYSVLFNGIINGKMSFSVFDGEGPKQIAETDASTYTKTKAMFERRLEEIDLNPTEFKKVDFLWALDNIADLTRSKVNSASVNNLSGSEEILAVNQEKDREEKAVEPAEVASVTCEGGAEKTGTESRPAMQFCRYCGGKLLSESIYCSYCGKKLI